MGVQASVGKTGDARIDGVLSGVRWGGGVVSYSGPDAASDYGAGYRTDFDGDGRSAQSDGFAKLSTTQFTSLRAVLDCGGGGSAGRFGFAVEGFTNLKVNCAGAGNGAGDIRVANCADVSTGYAYMPGSGLGGDVWLGGAGRAPRAGNYDNLTILHEVGHALGLKHPHEAGFAKVPLAYDTPEFTVMTYRSYVGGSPTGFHFESWGAPQSYMMLDIAALQQMYGADFSTNAGDTVYRWTPGSGRTLVDGKVGIDPGGNRIFATLWDGGGKDTYDLSAYETGVKIDLRPGQHSVFSGKQLADLGGGPNDGHARGNIFNALQYHGDSRSLIENARGGSASDKIVGNAAANCLIGNAGNDLLRGLGGKDMLIGGKGADVFVFASCSESRGSPDKIVAGAGAAAFEGAGRSGGDRIDVHQIDADTLHGGNQAFVFGGTGRGHLWLKDIGSITHVYGNTDNDAGIEFHLAISDGGLRASAYDAHDFIL